MGSAAALRPGLSVVIPVKDRAHLLDQTLRSVNGQSRRVDEILVVDDGSTDHSRRVASDHGATVISSGGVGRGPSVARNEGISRVSTEFMCPLDSDDLLRPTAVASLAEALTAVPEATFAFGRAFEAVPGDDGWRPDGIIAPRAAELTDLPCHLYARNFVPSSCTVVRTEALRDVGGYPEQLVFNEDHYLWLQLARRGSPVHVPEVLSVSRRHAGSRHDPLAHSSLDEITALAEEDSRLLPCRADRLGIQFINMLVMAAKGRQPTEMARAAWSVVVRQPRRGRIMRSALRHWRTRKASAREAEELWRDDPELRGFLDSYE
jgi:hypothetical protein